MGLWGKKLSINDTNLSILVSGTGHIATFSTSKCYLFRHSYFVPGLCVYRGDGSWTARRPSGCTSSRPTRGLRPTALSVRPGGRRPLLRQMVHRPSGVLPLHAQRAASAQGLPDPGSRRPRRTGWCVGNLANIHCTVELCS